MLSALEGMGDAMERLWPTGWGRPTPPPLGGERGWGGLGEAEDGKGRT